MVAWEALRLAPAFSEDIILTASGEDRLAAWEATREEITVATWEALRLAIWEENILAASEEDRLAAWEATREEITVATWEALRLSPWEAFRLAIWEEIAETTSETFILAATMEPFIEAPIEAWILPEWEAVALCMCTGADEIFTPLGPTVTVIEWVSEGCAWWLDIRASLLTMRFGNSCPNSEQIRGKRSQIFANSSTVSQWLFTWRQQSKLK